MSALAAALDAMLLREPMIWLDVNCWGALCGSEKDAFQAGLSLQTCFLQCVL